MDDLRSLMWLKIKELRPELMRFRTRPLKAQLIFVSGKYTGDVKENMAKALEAGVEIINRGHTPVIPHTMFNGMDDIVSYNEIMDCCIALIRQCDGVLFLEGWQDSNGARIEFLAANAFWRQLYFGVEDIPDLKK